MRKTALISIVAILCLMTGKAYAGDLSKKPDLALKYGVEWGYTATFFDYYHSNYFDPDVGYRIDNIETQFYLYSNAHVAAKIGVEFCRHYAVTLLAGYAGIKQDRRIFPVTVRAAFFPVSVSEDGWQFFGEGGAGLHHSSEPYSILGKLGAGYRIKLSRKSSLDFLSYLRLSTDHPGIYSMDIAGHIPEELVRRSDGLYGSLNFSISLNF